MKFLVYLASSFHQKTDVNLKKNTRISKYSVKIKALYKWNSVYNIPYFPHCWIQCEFGIILNLFLTAVDGLVTSLVTETQFRFFSFTNLMLSYIDTLSPELIYSLFVFQYKLLYVAWRVYSGHCLVWLVTNIFLL